MDEDDRPRPRGDAASLLAGESLDSYSIDELNYRIQLLETEVVRIVALRDKAKEHLVAAEALFSPGAGSPATKEPGTSSAPATQKPDTRSSPPPKPDTR